jgi:hypothetical protein
MLHVPIGSNSFSSVQSSTTTRPSITMGVQVTPATASKGAWSTLYVSTTYDSYGILICINSNTASATSRNTITDIGVDETGGASYQVQIPDLISGNAGGYHQIGMWYYFPLFIPSGSRIAARGQGTVTTAYRVYTQLLQAPLNSSQIRKGSYVDVIGAAGVSGTTLLPGTTAKSSWALLGTTSRRIWWWQLGVQVTSADATHQNAAYQFDLAVGNGDVFDIIIPDLQYTTTTAEVAANPPISAGVEYPVPAGTNIYVRGWGSTTVDSMRIKAYGLGG